MWQHRPRLQCAALVLAAAMLAGCAAPLARPPPPQPGAPVPARWVAAAAQHLSDAEGTPWWRGWSDPALSALVAEAVRNNHDLSAAAARVETAAATSRGAAAELLPTLGAGLQATRSRQPGPAGTPVNATGYGVALDASWEVDLWGRLRAGRSAAAADLQAQRAEYAAAALSLAAQTSKAWLGLVESLQQAALAEATAASYADTARRARDRVDAGVQQPNDAHLAETSLASAQATLLLRREAVERLTRQLEVLLGRYPAGTLETGSLLPTPPDALEAGVPARMLSRRPDLRALEDRITAADFRVEAARDALLPALTLTGGASRGGPRLADLVSGQVLWSLAGNLVQPLFDGGRLRAQVDVARARERELLESYAQRALEAFAEVETALSVDQLLARRDEALGRAGQSARRAEQVSTDRYRAGVDPFLPVLESQRRAFDADSALLAVRRQRLENRIDLHLALGDGVDELMNLLERPLP